MNKYLLSALAFSCFINADRAYLSSSEFQLFPIGRKVVKEASSDTTGGETWRAKYSKDFTITGDGSAVNWNNTEWLNLPLRGNKEVAYKTKIKMLYSDSGIYCLYHCEDKKITATLKDDFLDFCAPLSVVLFAQPKDEFLLAGDDLEAELVLIDSQLPHAHLFVR